jgi:hypothetical protein
MEQNSSLFNAEEKSNCKSNTIALFNNLAVRLLITEYVKNTLKNMKP